MSTTRNTQPSWRQRMLEKERQEREALVRAADMERQKHYAKTETNFPTTIIATTHTFKPVLPTAFAKTAAEAEERDNRRRQRDAYANSQFERQRREALHTVSVFHRKNTRYVQDYDEEDTETVPEPIVNDEYPPHGRRGTYTEADNDGWRLVTKRQRRKRELTEAELERKYRAEILSNEEDDDGDLNEEVAESGQRRDFY